MVLKQENIRAENLPADDVPGITEERPVKGGQCGCAGGNREEMRRDSVSGGRRSWAPVGLWTSVGRLA